MDKKIYAICTTLNAGTDYDKEKIEKAGIKVGDKIELENAYVGSWETEICLVGYDSLFNSVFFKYVDEDGRKYNIYEKYR